MAKANVTSYRSSPRPVKIGLEAASLIFNVLALKFLLLVLVTNVIFLDWIFAFHNVVFLCGYGEKKEHTICSRVDSGCIYSLISYRRAAPSKN